MKKITTILLLFAFFSCNQIPPLNKKKLIERYEKFVTEIGKKYKDYSETDWEESDKNFEYLNLQYEKFEEEMTQDEKSKIMKLQGKYIGYRTKDRTNDFIEEWKDRMNNVLDKLEGFFESMEEEPKDTVEKVE